MSDDRPPYDHLADQYADVFSDFTVRKCEWRWLSSRIVGPASSTLLDLGCGNGSFLSLISNRIAKGVGVDVSERMVEQARFRNAHLDNLAFERLTEKKLPFPDSSFDFVTSVLSMRYMHWEAMFAEIARVLKSSGWFLMVDMVSFSNRIHHVPRVVFDHIGSQFRALLRPRFRQSLKTLVSLPQWKQMLDKHPPRLFEEYERFLYDRFPNGRLSVLSRGWGTLVIGFESSLPNMKRRIDESK